jgi:hypothetical protein
MGRVPAEQYGAMSTVAVAHTRAEFHQIVVRVHHFAFERLLGLCIIHTSIERHPAAPIFCETLYFRPRKTTAHSLLAL